MHALQRSVIHIISYICHFVVLRKRNLNRSCMVFNDLLHYFMILYYLSLVSLQPHKFLRKDQAPKSFLIYRLSYKSTFYIVTWWLKVRIGRTAVREDIVIARLQQPNSWALLSNGSINMSPRLTVSRNVTLTLTVSYSPDRRVLSRKWVLVCDGQR
jgi:hypothetical protein